jgi:phosphoglycerate dehydrogenase-like enzyme
MPDVNVLIAQPFPDPLVDRLRAVSTLLRFHVHPARSAEELPADLLPDAEILYTMHALPQPEHVPNLRWIQFHTAGVDRAAEHPLLRSGVVVTTLSGTAVPQMAEYVVAAMTSMARRVPGWMREKSEKHWPPDRFERFLPVELRGSTLGIAGYGSVGREVARLARGLGMKVLATKRDLKHLDDDGYRMDGLGDPSAQLADRLYPPQALRSMAGQCDFLVITVPLTPETRGMVNQAVLEAMKPTAFLIDVSRGGVVDHGALVESLRNEKLGGAVLDVFPVEPLPDSSPLWELPNVLISPHVAGASAHYFERAADLFAQNLRRYLADQPLLNRYDPVRGY